MLSKCRGIVFRTVDYSESSVILHCYTDLFGLQSYLLNGVRKGKGTIRPSHLMPLNLLEMEVYHQQNKSLQRIRELKCTPPLHQLQFFMAKRTIAMFLSELLSRSIHEEAHPDPDLFEYLFNTIQLLDLAEGSLGNFPLCFLVQFSKYLGFAPKDNRSDELPVFHLKLGEFVSGAPESEIISGAAANALQYFLKEGFNHWQTPALSGEQRRYLLGKLISFLQEHRVISGNLRSPAVLHVVLD